MLSLLATFLSLLNIFKRLQLYRLMDILVPMFPDKFKGKLERERLKSWYGI